MIKKLIILLSLVWAVSISASATNVTGQVKDINSNLYRSCTGGANFIGQAGPGQGPYLLQGSVFPQSSPIFCDSQGNFTVSLPDNNLISPTPSQWNFSFCSAIGAFPGPPICFNVLITITGVSQNVTTQVQLAAALLPVTGVGLPPAGNGTHVATTNLVNGGVGGNCVTWLTGGVLGDTGSPCGSGGGGGGSPGAPTNSIQVNQGTFAGAAGTSFNASTGQMDISNLSNVRYAVTANNWSQTITGTLTGGSPATVVLNPCPIGIDGRDNISYVYISGVGTPEPVQLTGGGSCRPGNASGSINFTPLNNHSTGYTIGSGSSGIQESINQFANWTGTGGSANATVVIEPAGLPVAQGNTANDYIVNATITFGGINALTLIGDGAVLGCNTRDSCITFNNSSTVTMKGFRMASNLLVEGWSITNVVCTAGVATITTSTNHGILVGDTVDIHDTDDSFYWGGSVSQRTRVSAVTSNTVSYPINSGNCASGGGSTRASLNTPGTINILNAAYFGGVTGNGGSGSSLTGLSLNIPGGTGSIFTGHFNNGVVVMDDEAFRVRDMTGGSLNNKGSMCSGAKPYCGALIYAPGPFTGGSGVLWISDSDLTAQCSSNPVVAFNGNTVHLNNVITQSQAKVSVQASSRRGGFGNVILDNVYDEQGNCTNPDSGLVASEGYVFYANAARVSGGEGPQANIPNFTNVGGTTFYYYLIPNIGSDSMPYYFGTAAPSGSFGGQFPRVMPVSVGTTNITYTQPTYSILRTTDISNYPTTASCPGGSTTTCGLVATGLTQCSGLWCAFTDDSTVATTAATINPSGYLPDVTFWPGHIILNGGATLWLDTNQLLPANDVITNLSNGNASNSVFTLRNTGNVQSWVTGFSTGIPATTFADTSVTSGLKGGLNVVHGFSPSTTVPIGELFTLVDSNPPKTLANINKRPSQDAADTYFGNDLTANLTSVGLAIGAPVAITNYINSSPVGLGWGERLTAGKKEFGFNTQFDAPMTSLIGCTGCGPFNRTTAPVFDSFNRSPASTLGGNWTTILGTLSIVNGGIFGGINYATSTNNANDGAGNNRAYGFYSGTSFTGDQYAQAIIVPNQLIDICVRMQNSSPVTAYCVSIGSSSGTSTALVKLNAGSTVNLVGSLGTIPGGSYVKIEAVGSTITAYVNGALVGSATDTSITGGAPGIMCQNNVSNNEGFSNFYAGNASWTSQEPITTAQLSTGTSSNTDLAGQLTMVAGTIARSFAGTYASAPICTATDTTAINAVQVVVTNTTLTINGTGTDVVDYICVGRN